MLRWVARGLTNTQIAEQLVISALTVMTPVQRIYSKLGVSTRGATIRMALDYGLS